MTMELYNRVREVPEEAKKTIRGGRLKGMTDINPMWRIKKLTEEFGPCGIGWYYTIDDRWVERSTKDEITANVIISLYYKMNGEWSMPVQGIGGSMLVASEKNGLYTNDECFKMATTDAISVACKALGMGANVYWDKDNTKYNDSKREYEAETNSIKAEEDRLSRTPISNTHAANIMKEAARIGVDLTVILNEYAVDDIAKMTEAQYGDCMNKLIVTRRQKEERTIGAE